MTPPEDLDSAENPTWLLEPPECDEIAPPVEPNEQLLPFGALTPIDFERLCLQLARREGEAEYWRIYGTTGHEQGGIDIFVRQKASAKYAVWQSKRHKTFAPTKMNSAVTKFLAGDWASKSDLFVLCVQASLNSPELLDNIENCAATLRDRGIVFMPLDGEKLSEKLKAYPDVVNDFFGPVWLRRFCGQIAADAVAARLKPSEFRQLKGRLDACYASIFRSVDPGVLGQITAPLSARNQLQLAERFVEPDLTFESSRNSNELPSSAERAPPQNERSFDQAISSHSLPLVTDSRIRVERTRKSLEFLVSDAKHEIVLGAAGAGKSTLLRFIALDMLSPDPRLVGLRRKLPEHLPVWVSFAFWTRLIATNADRSSLIDAIEAWFRRQDEVGLITLVRKAFEDKRLVLLVDGIDEWENETAARTAVGLLQSYCERHSVPVIMTGRPHGFRLISGFSSTWRVSEIAPFSTTQQVALATAWFVHLGQAEVDASIRAATGRREAIAFIAELQRNGPIAQLAATPLLLTGLIALKVARMNLPRNRFLAYEDLSTLLLEVHPISRDKAALAGVPRFNLDQSTIDVTLAALAYAAQTNQEGTSIESVDLEQATDVIKLCLIERVGLTAADALTNARSILNLGEETIGVLVKKSPREIGFFHRVFQELFASRHLAGMEFDRLIALVSEYASDARWRDVILCLLHQLHRPHEVDRLLLEIENVEGDPATLATRDILLAEATFVDFKKTPALASKLAEQVFAQIESDPRAPVRAALLAQVIDGQSSPVLGPSVSEKLQQWFPRWHSYGLVGAFEVIAEWPADSGVDRVLWRGLNDEYFGAARSAAKSIAKRLGGSPDAAEKLCRLISQPASLGIAAAAIEALSLGWPTHPKLAEILDIARISDSPLIAIAAIRGRVALNKHNDDDFSFLTQFDNSSTHSFDDLIEEVLLRGWAGDKRLREFAVRTAGRRGDGMIRRPRPDFGLLINVFPGDPEVAALVVADLRQQHPSCLFEKGDLRALATNFKNDPTIVAALEAWVEKYERDDAYTISHAARVAPTQKFKAFLLKCVESNHLAFWAASALIDLWGSDDESINSLLKSCAELPVEKRQNIAHVLPLVIADKAHCRQLLLEIVASKEKVRADFALQGLRKLGIDSSDQEATDCVLARDYDEERFLVENEAREVIRTFSSDERVIAMVKRMLRREFSPIETIARVYSHDAEMRGLILGVSAPLDVSMRSAQLDGLALKASSDASSRLQLSDGRRDASDEIIVGSAIALARTNKERQEVSDDYLADVQNELLAIGPRMDARRQGAFGALVVIRRLDLMPGPDSSYNLRELGFHKDRGLLRLLATEWTYIVEALGGEVPALGILGVDRTRFFDVFGNDLDASEAISGFALKLVEEIALSGAPAAAIRYVESVRPNSGFLRDLCLTSLLYTGHTNWDTFSTALTAGETLGRGFAGDPYVEAQLLQRLAENPQDSGTIAALCEGWPKSEALGKVVAALEDHSRLPLAIDFKLVSAIADQERFSAALAWAANELEGDLWEAIPHWLPSVLRRLKDDDIAYEKARDALFTHPSPGVKASFPKILSRARGFSQDLREWCQAESQQSSTKLVGEVGFDIIAGQTRLVAHSLFDLFSGRDI